jgi:hypothetical protein
VNFLAEKRPQQGAFLLPKFNLNLGNDILSTIFGTQLHFFYTVSATSFSYKHGGLLSKVV